MDLHETCDLGNGYYYSVDMVDKNHWYKIIGLFEDVNIYQTWAYNEIQLGGKNISNLVLHNGDKILAAAQARIFKIPGINSGIAYIRWGPLWKLRGEKESVEVFIRMVRALRNEYVLKRNLVLKIAPVLFDDDIYEYGEIFRKEHFILQENIERQKTLVIDLSLSLEELRKGFEQKWRNCLNRSGRNNLLIISGDTEELFDTFMKIYDEMIKRKNFSTSTNLSHFKYINAALPNEFKNRVFICLEDGTPSSGAICSALGGTAIYLFGATNNVGMKNNGSYLIQWEIIKWLKNKKCNSYNLNGINIKNNPGTYRFKIGLSGKNGQEKRYVGQFNSNNNLISYCFVSVGEALLYHYRKLVQYF